MICLITGVPGSGKSLALTKRFIIPALKKGRRIYTNIDGLNDSAPNPYILALSFASGVPPEDVEKLIFKFPSKDFNKVLMDMPASAIAIIDEAQIFWNARDFASDKNKEVLPYFQKHRHYGHDVILATQHFEQLDSGIRRLAEVHYRLKRLKNVGLSKVIKVSVFNQGISIEGKPVAHEAWSIDRSIFGCYKSYENNKIAEVKYKSHNVFLRSPFLWVCFIVGLFSVYLVVTRLPSFLRGDMWNNRSLEVKKDFSKFDLGEYEEYYCGDKFYVLRFGGKVDTIPKKDVPPTYCPHINFNFKRASK